jgi:polysaccharide pyruvyl transferase WcaK-like protein
MIDRAVNKVAVFGHVGKGNLGDEATLAAALQNVRLRHPGVEIVAFTLNPADTAVRHGVVAFPIRRVVDNHPVDPTQSQAAAPPAPSGGVKHWVKKIPVVRTVLRGLLRTARAVPAALQGLAFLAQSRQRLKGTDLFIVAGGGQLGDYFGGAWGFPLTILTWTLLARSRGARVAFLSTGAGPFTTRLGKRFLRWALNRADYRSFRDDGSRALTEALGLAGESQVFPDLVHGLHVPALARPRHGGQRVVGINPLPFHDARYWAEDSPNIYQEYIEKLAAFAARVIEAGHRVLLFPTQVVADPPVIRDVEALVRRRLPALADGALECPVVAGFDDLFTALECTDIVVASRFHGIVFSFLAGRPVIGLSYNPKTDELMAGMGQAEFVADIARFEVAWLVDRFERLRACSAVAVCDIEQRAAANRAALECQYDLLLNAAPRPEPRLAAQTA